MKYLRAILLLPFTVTVAIPVTILWLTGPGTFDLWQSVPIRVGLWVLGVAVICLGLVLMVATIRLFVTVGKGTLGGHVDACSDCGLVRVSYNSCRNRHCPKCQAARQHNLSA